MLSGFERVLGARASYMMMVFFIYTHFFQLFKMKVKANKVLFYGQAGAFFLFHVSFSIHKSPLAAKQSKYDN
jgi:hypothetical protein